MQGSGPKRGLVGLWGSSVEGLPLPLLNHLYLFHCVLVSSSVAVVAIYEMALKLFSVSAFPLCLPLTLSLSVFLLQFLLLLLFPVSVTAVAFPFTSFVPKQLALWLWLNALIYQIGRRPRCYTPLSPLLSAPFPCHALLPSFSLQARTLRALPIGDFAAQGFTLPSLLPYSHPAYL